MSRRLATATVAAAVLVLAVACAPPSTDPAPGPSPSRTDPTTAPPAAGPLRWERCGSVECAALDVPLVHGRPGMGAVTLRLARHRATAPERRVGVLLVNPGGPGVPALFLAQRAGDYFDPALLERFDVVAWDPRGVGTSTSVDCVDDLDGLLAVDPTPDDERERVALAAVASAFGAACRERSGDLLGWVGTAHSALDVEAVRQALGEPQVSFLGFSYGAELAATAVRSHPEAFRVLALDGGSDPDASPETLLLAQGRAFEAALGAALDACDAEPACRLGTGGPAGPAFDRVLARLDRAPLPQEGRPPLGQGAALVAVVQGLYDDATWPRLLDAVAAAGDGDPGPLQDLADAYLDRRPDGSWPDTYEAHLAIGCADRVHHAGRAPTAVEVQALADRAAAVAPRLGAFVAGAPWCVGWASPDGPPGGTASGGAASGSAASGGTASGGTASEEPPVPALVVGTSGDTATPYDLTVALARDLPGGVLLTWDGRRHGAYLSSACVRAAVDRALVEARLPRPGTVCR